MVKIERHVFINEPLPKVFSYAEDPANQPEFWPSLVEVSEVEQLSNGGTRNRWVYKMAGLRFQGTAEITEYVANHHWVSQTEGGIVSTQVWTFKSEHGGTRVTFESEYSVPVPLIRRLAEAFVTRLNEREAETLLNNLKDMMES